MIDARTNDHKVIAVATGDPEFNAYQDVSQLPQHRLLVLRRFFQDYKQLEGKIVEVEEIAPTSSAHPVIENALDRYSEYKQRGSRS